MAEDQDDSQKTEEPSHRKLEEARKKGQVATSQEVKHWFVLLGGVLVIGIFGPIAAEQISARFAGYLTRLEQIPADGSALVELARRAVADFTMILILPLLVLVIAAMAGSLIQHGPMLAAESLKPKLEKLSPLAGLKRQFSAKALAEFAKGIIKLVIVGAVAVVVVMPEFRGIEQFAGLDPASLLTRIWALAIRLMIAVLAIMALIAVLDYLYQRFEFMKQQRMTKQEVKDEFKQSEGDPMIKARLRGLRMERARQRMMQAVPQADVVITNPTHYAVAMKYDPATMGAPKVVAKGVDQIALKIREVAREHDVAIVENPPLARALHAAVEIDQDVPPEHYRAVAEVISYVFKLQRRAFPAS
ncbi:MAG TPA: flagellar biosynthesis protein FlhB [Alphaproteobacteria bacterium]|nr:flagellar biosynthesis protein FlhB [Alphaproteobacteria bacterium]